MEQHTPVTNSMDSILQQLAQCIDCPEDKAEMLDPAQYHDTDLLELEIDRIFRTEWICVARTDQLEKPGDYLTTELVGEQLLVVRTRENELVTYSNVCRHRYFPVAHGSGNAERFTCDYHKWTYGLDGRLLGAPGMQGTSLDKRTCRLPEIPTEIWNGFVFVNLDRDAEPLAPRIAALSERTAAYELEAMSAVAIDDSIWAGNWKLTMENALDSYHHMGLHEKSLQADMPGLGTEFQGDHETWAHHHTPFSERFADEVAQTVPQSTARLRPEDRATMNVFYIYPSFVMPLLPVYGNWLSIIPINLGETRVFTGLLFGDEYRETSGVDEQTLAAQSLDSLRAINAEDQEATLRLQRSTQSRFIERGVMSRKEIGILHFYRYLARKLL